jgi:hypothetical protein
MLPIAHSNTTNHTYQDLSSQDGSKKNYISKNLELPTIVTQKSTNNQQLDSSYTHHYSPYQMSSPKNQGAE